MLRFFLFLFLLFVTPVQAREWFVQISSEQNRPVEVDPETVDLGRVEITVKEEFRGCLRGFTVKGWNSLILVPFDVGFRVQALTREDIKIESFGILKTRIKLSIKITPIGE